MYLKLMLAASAMALSGGAVLAKDQTPPEMLDDRAMFASGEDAFNKTCARCHTGVESAVGPNLRSGDYDADILKFFARHGSGPMPAFTQSMIDDATLDALANYVVETSQGDSQ